MRFLLAPHAITQWNLDGRIQGHTNINLCPEGIQQAQRLAQKAKGMNINSIVSSDLLRAVHTAEIVNGMLQISIKTDKRLRECCFGQVEGKTLSEMFKEFGESIRTHVEDRGRMYDFTPWGGESYAHVFERQLAVLRACMATMRDQVILLVGHGRALDTILIGLGHEPGIERGSFREIDVDATPLKPHIEISRYIDM